MQNLKNKRMKNYLAENQENTKQLSREFIFFKCLTIFI